MQGAHFIILENEYFSNDTNFPKDITFDNRFLYDNCSDRCDYTIAIKSKIYEGLILKCLGNKK